MSCLFFLLFQGATIKRHELSGEIFIARVIHGGLANRSGEPGPAPCSTVPRLLIWSVVGLLHAGDRIVEVNGFCVAGMEPEQVIQVVVRTARTTLSAELLPHPAPHHPSLPPTGQIAGFHRLQGGSHYREAGPPPDDGRRCLPRPLAPPTDPVLMPLAASPQLYMRAMVNYNPQQDPAIPCADAGVCFRKGDILEIVDQSDAFWWQARKLPSQAGCAGLVPSSSLLQRCELPPPKQDPQEYCITCLLCGQQEAARAVVVAALPASHLHAYL